MKEKIKEVQDYFKNSILKGEFQVIKAEDIIVDIIIDNEFQFSIWVKQEHDSFEQWDHRTNSFKLPFFTKAERLIGFEIFNPIIKEAEDKRLKTTKLDQYNKLRSELEHAGILTKTPEQKGIEIEEKAIQLINK